MKPAATPPPARGCRQCGHWQSGVELGMDTRTGFCNYWRKLTSFDYTCEHFLDKVTFQREQDRKFEEMAEEGMEE